MRSTLYGKHLPVLPASFCESSADDRGSTSSSSLDEHNTTSKHTFVNTRLQF